MFSSAALSLVNRVHEKLLMVILSGAIALFAASAHAQSASGTSNEKTLRVAVTLPIYVERFDPNNTFFSTDDIVLGPLFDRLMTFDPQGNRQMLAARSVDFSADGMSIKVVIRDDLFWSYGEKVVAADYVRGLERAAMANSRAVHLMSGIRGSQKWAVGDYTDPFGIEAPDDQTFVVHLDHAFRFDITNLMNMQANPYPPANRVSGPLIATNGPYMLKSMDKEFVSLVRNPHYRGENPYFDRIEFLGFSHDIAVDYFISKKADLLIGPVGKQKKWLLDNYNNDAIETGLPRKYILAIAHPSDHTSPAMQKVEVRRALYAALDREAFEKSDSFFKKQWHCGFIPVASPCNDERKRIWHDDDTMDQRIRKAKEAIRQAGYSPENPLKLSLIVPTSIRGYTEIAGFVKSSWREIGVDVELVNIANYLDAFQAIKAGKYDLLINSFYQLVPHQYIYRAETFGVWALNFGPRNAFIDDLVLRISRSSGVEFAKLIIEVERNMMETMTMIPVASDSQIGFYADWLAPNQENVSKLNLRYFKPK